jgi:MucB/RseB N-terminal domain
MSVVTGSTRRRWACVAGLTCLLALAAAAPRAAGVLADEGTGGGVAAASPRSLLRAALASRAVPYSGLGESHGSLGLPTLPGLGRVPDLLGGTTRTRVWWAAADSWRVDVVTPTGEQGTYGTPAGVVTWDYERRRLQSVLGEPDVRLPRADDLLAPQAARRLLAGVGPGDGVQPLPRARVAGRPAVGLRVVPSDPRSTIGAADVWLDGGSGLPLRLRVVDRKGSEFLVTELSEVHLRRPADATTTPPSPAGVAVETVFAPDLAAAVDRRAPWRLPDQLAGLPVTRSLLEGSATYGRGLVRFSVLPLPSRTADAVLDSARSAGAAELDLPAGSGAQVSSTLLDVVVVEGDDGEHSYLLAGLVTPAVLTTAAQQLLLDPPPRRYP